MVITTISVGHYPNALAHNPIQNRVYVADYGSSSISVIRDAMSNITEPIGNCKLEIENWNVYPNPAKSYFTIYLPQTTNSSEIKIFDVVGKIVKEVRSKKQEIRISLDGIKNGVYFVKIDDNAELSKIVITK